MSFLPSWARISLCWLALGGEEAWSTQRVAFAQTPAPALLDRSVRLPVGWVSLRQVLAEASRQSGVPISYSSTRLAASARLYLPPGPARPLGAVLRDVLGPRHVAYGLLGGQVVLWPARQAVPPGITCVNWRGTTSTAGMGGVIGSAATLVVPASRQGTSASSRKARLARPPAGAEPAAGVASAPGTSRTAGADDAGQAVNNEKLVATRRAGNRQRRMARLLQKAKRPPPGTGQVAAGPVVNPAPTTAPDEHLNQMIAVPEVAALVVQAEVSPATWPATLPLVPPPAPSALAPPLHRRRLQLGLIYPLGTNGMANARTTSQLSVNALVGYAAGIEGIEVGGWANIVRDSVHGIQGAGLFNVTGTAVRGVQVAGFANITGGAMYGAQGAGLVNIVRDDARGIQVAGLVNVVGGASHARNLPDQPTRVRRWLGQPRRLATDALGRLPAAPSVNARGPLLQAAALANLTGTDVRGVQTASLLNVACRVKGVQFGLVNVARHVRGVQLGLINVADSVDGVALGLINIVRHGYLRGELWTSESLPLNAVVKLGVPRYYTLLGAAAEPFGNRVQWAAGFGVGTVGRPHGRFTLSLDVVEWTLAGTSSGADVTDQRLLTQLRPAVAWQIEREGHLQLVVSPTLNWAMAWRRDGQPGWDFGANQFLFLNTADDHSLSRLWPGLQVGLRF